MNSWCHSAIRETCEGTTEWGKRAKSSQNPGGFNEGSEKGVMRSGSEKGSEKRVCKGTQVSWEGSEKVPRRVLRGVLREASDPPSQNLL